MRPVPAVAFPDVTDQLLQRLVDAVLIVGNPLRVVLFGSQVRGDARSDSDLDLLIVEESQLPRHERSPRYYLALAKVFPAKDIVVYTPTEVADWSQVPNALVTAALREGKTLYARPG